MFEALLTIFDYQKWQQPSKSTRIQVSCANTPNSFNKNTKLKEGQVTGEVSIRTDM